MGQARIKHKAAQPTEVTPFTLKVIEKIRGIPKGKVATYAQIADLAGRPHASRGVSWILNSCSKAYKLPWHRVIKSEGRIAFKPGTRNFLLQFRLLKREGVEVDRASGRVDFTRYQDRRRRLVRKRNQPKMFS